MALSLPEDNKSGICDKIFNEIILKSPWQRYRTELFNQKHGKSFQERN